MSEKTSTYEPHDYMNESLLEKLLAWTKHYSYWGLMTGIALLAEVVALYYQYVLHEDPCIVCIHIRLWFTGFILLGLVGLKLRHSKAGLLIGHIIAFILAGGLLERSYHLYAIENGLIEGSCNFSLGLPSWFTPDQWLPLVYKATALCGYTPDLWFGITMAEGLLASAILAILACTLVLILQITRLFKS